MGRAAHLVALLPNQDGATGKMIGPNVDASSMMNEDVNHMAHRVMDFHTAQAYTPLLQMPPASSHGTPRSTKACICECGPGNLRQGRAVVVSRICGDDIQLSVSCTAKLSHIKEKLASSCGCAADRIVLFDGDVNLGDDDHVAPQLSMALLNGGRWHYGPYVDQLAQEYELSVTGKSWKLGLFWKLGRCLASSIKTLNLEPMCPHHFIIQQCSGTVLTMTDEHLELQVTQSPTCALGSNAPMLQLLHYTRNPDGSLRGCLPTHRGLMPSVKLHAKHDV